MQIRGNQRRGNGDREETVLAASSFAVHQFLSHFVREQMGKERDCSQFRHRPSHKRNKTMEPHAYCTCMKSSVLFCIF